MALMESLGLELRLDPWQAEYGSELPMSDSEPSESIDASVEVDERLWAPLAPRPDAPRPRRLVFTDGVRRVDARAVGRRGDRIVHGAFGSFGVGAVVVEDGRARFGEGRVERVLALGSGESLPGPWQIAPALSYRPVSAAESDPDAPLRRLQDEMRLAEERLARDESAAPETLVVADGPLRFGDARGGAVGYVKRLFARHGVSLAALAALDAGQRTPLIAIDGGSFARYSWCLRLARRAAADFDLAGIVRLEVSEAVGLEAARALADGSAAWLPRFAPTRSRDPRAPQNLLPIGALEARLRRLMGDPVLNRRRIEGRIAKEAVSA